MICVYYVADWGRDHWLVTDDEERRYLVCIADLCASAGGPRAERGRMVEVPR